MACQMARILKCQGFPEDRIPIHFIYFLCTWRSEDSWQNSEGVNSPSPKFSGAREFNGQTLYSETFSNF